MAYYSISSERGDVVYTLLTAVNVTEVTLPNEYLKTLAPPVPIYRGAIEKVKGKMNN